MFKNQNDRLVLLLTRCGRQWPNLKATTVLGAGVDFALIPRAMQVDEDFTACVAEYKSLAVLARSLR